MDLTLALHLGTAYYNWGRFDWCRDGIVIGRWRKHFVEESRTRKIGGLLCYYGWQNIKCHLYYANTRISKVIVAINFHTYSLFSVLYISGGSHFLEHGKQNTGPFISNPSYVTSAYWYGILSHNVPRWKDLFLSFLKVFLDHWYLIEAEILQFKVVYSSTLWCYSTRKSSCIQLWVHYDILYI